MRERFKRVLAQVPFRTLILACLLLLCACMQCAECSAWLKSCRQQWLRRQRRALRACVQWVARTVVRECFKRVLAQVPFQALNLACLLLLCACRQCAECSAWLKSCRQQCSRRW